jgi:hypothetical protein
MLTFTIPGKSESTPNLREHWAAKAKRLKKQRDRTLLLCPKWKGGPLLVVTLTRYGVRELDGDNWQAAAKAYRDGIAARLRVDDGTSLVRWEYRQEKCSAGEERVEVEISSAGPK